MMKRFLILIVALFSLSAHSMEAKDNIETQNIITTHLESIKKLVVEHYEESWYVPSQEEIVDKIDSIFDKKTIEDYTPETIKSFPEKLNQLKLALHERCHNKFDGIHSKIKSVVDEYLTYL